MDFETGEACLRRTIARHGWRSERFRCGSAAPVFALRRRNLRGVFVFMVTWCVVSGFFVFVKWASNTKSRFPFGVNCRRGAKNSLFLDLERCARALLSKSRNKALKLSSGRSRARIPCDFKIWRDRSCTDTTLPRERSIFCHQRCDPY